jgi:hypothetical protein
VVAATLVLGSAAGAEPRAILDPARPHLHVPLQKPPSLKFHPDSQRVQPPLLVLDDSGLYRDGVRICTWPGGTFDIARWDEMVLKPVQETSAGECPALPVVSTEGTLGIGIAKLYVEFVRHDAVSLEARCAHRPCYLTMASLPPGWSEEPSTQASERKRRAEVAAARKKDPALGEFLDGSNACLSQKDTAACLAAFVSESASLDMYPDPPRQLPDPGPKRARAVIDHIWSSQEGREWVGDCIRLAPAGYFEDSVPELSVHPPRSFRICTIRKEPGGWRLLEVWASD